ncbi:MAG: DUF4139 domain-containing protein [Flavobacteriales bacterium]|nr:DUF4139 domain-containing protein [Flavobacteriales bacterium]
MVVEIDVQKETSASFVINYISPRATWKPYYDMRSDGIGKPVRLEAKANVSQTTGIEWKDVDMVLSTNDPYQNAQEPTMNPWYIYYNNQPQTFRQAARSIPATDFSGEKVRGEVIDAATGEPMPFTKVAIYGNTAINVVTDFDGKFEITIPKGASYLNATFVGYTEQNLYISAAYLKFFMAPIGVDISTLRINDVEGQNGMYRWDASGLASDGEYSYSTTTQNKMATITKEDISRLPARNSNRVASTVGGVNDEDDKTSIFDKKTGTKDRERYKLETRSQEQQSTLQNL